MVSKRFLPAILKALNDPGAAWWELDGALFALGQAEPGDIRGQLPLIQRFLRHEEWYLREAAFWAIVGLHGTITGEEFNLLTDSYGRSRHVFARSSYDAGFRTLLKGDRVALDRANKARAIETLGRTTYDVPVALGYGTGGVHEAAHRTMMILKHFDPGVYRSMAGDFVAYLRIWEPYYQHSVWLITGSRWQPGILAVLDDMGPEARTVVDALKNVLRRYDSFDPKRLSKEGQAVEAKIRAAVAEWEGKGG